MTAERALYFLQPSLNFLSQHLFLDNGQWLDKMVPLSCFLWHLLTEFHDNCTSLGGTANQKSATFALMCESGNTDRRKIIAQQLEHIDSCLPFSFHAWIRASIRAVADIINLAIEQRTVNLQVIFYQKKKLNISRYALQPSLVTCAIQKV